MSIDPKHIRTNTDDIPMAVQLAPTDVLVAELIRRSDLFLMVTRYKPLANEPRANAEDFRFGGESMDFRALQGMAYGAMAKIEQYINHVARNTPEEWER
jgi:hypothetical protein